MRTVLIGHLAALAIGLLGSHASVIDAQEPQADNVILASPSDYQVFQRQTRLQGRIIISGRLGAVRGELHFRLSGRSLEGELTGEWKRLATDAKTGAFRAESPATAGGWYRLELRVLRDGNVVAQQTVEHVGVGEVFVVAGQSNSTNCGSEKQKTKTGMVATFDGAKWRVADDPQPGVQDNSTGGSFLAPFGDALWEKYRVPIGVSSCGCGATSVRQWLMKGERIEVLPTLTNFVKTVGPKQWEAEGTLFDGLMDRIRKLGSHGFRAVLWHQGESDAGQARSGYPADRQISGQQYRTLLEKIVRASKDRAGWQFPWFVAQATYHTPQDASDAEFRQAQKSLWGAGIAQPGPDTDTLIGDLRDGVHFNGKGLRAHGRLWAEKVVVYLDRVLADE